MRCRSVSVDVIDRLKIKILFDQRKIYTWNLFNQEKTTLASNKMKRYRATMDNEYLLKILNVPGYKSE